MGEFRFWRPGCCPILHLPLLPRFCERKASACVAIVFESAARKVEFAGRKTSSLPYQAFADLSLNKRTRLSS